MIISVDKHYYARVDSPLLGYMGETESRTITVQGYQTEGADRYTLRLSYADGAQYDVDITSGTYNVQASLLRAAGSVKCQLLAVKSTGADTYEYVKKTNIFTVTIKPSVGGEEPVPTYEETVSVLEKVLAAEIAADECISAANTAVGAANTATSAAGTATENADIAVKSAATATENASQTAADREAVESAKSEVLAARDAAVSSAEAAVSARDEAVSSAESANTANTAAQTARTAAEQAATAAEENKTTAETAAQNAVQAEQNAGSAAATATEQATAAQTSAESASSSASLAETSATNAAGSATAAQSAQTAAETAKTAAETAQGVAEQKAAEIAESAEQITANKENIAELQDEMDLVQDILSGRAVESWAEVQMIVRAGQASKYFSVGDQFVCSKTDDSGNVQELVWDIIGIDHDTPTDTQFEHSLTLQLHDCYASMQYDAAEALFVFSDGLTAGTYYFTIDSTYDTANNDYSGYQFTLTQDIPAGGIITFPWGSNVKASTVNISSYASVTATTAIETVSTTDGTTGANLGNVTTAGDPENNINSIQRARYGSNNWHESAIRQYLNSDKAVNTVWTPQTKFDRPPSWVRNTAGFMNGLDKDFISSLGKVKKTTALNKIIDGGTGEESEELIFLLSRSEVYGAAEVSGVDEGSIYSYYKNVTNAERIKTLNGSACRWWLRTPSAGDAYYVRGVHTSGTVSLYDAGLPYGVAPACCIV